jgi:hypothetical protein
MAQVGLVLTMDKIETVMRIENLKIYKKPLTTYLGVNTFPEVNSLFRPLQRPKTYLIFYSLSKGESNPPNFLYQGISLDKF